MSSKKVLMVTDINGSLRECLDITHDMSYPGYVRVEFASNRSAPATYFEWYPVQDFLAANPDQKQVVKKAKQPAEDDLGVVSRSTTTSITDKTKKWKADCYIGFPLWISRGVGEGQVKHILSNSKNSVTVDSPFDPIPDKTSQYVISSNVHDNKPLGNTLPLS
ncbi:MAG: hypothetical protein ACMG6E_03250 [Candidatus Roizmanbacteria bacterium]